MDGLGNLTEYVVHHEDVRRAQPNWVARDLPVDLADELWNRLSQWGRIMYRRVPVGVTLARTDGAGGRLSVRKGALTITIAGTAQELLLRTHGRKAVELDIEGDPEAIAAFESTPLSI
jgi:uncharacterized protein (TIGR03085 family)